MVPSMGEIMVISLVVLLVFGAKRLPEIAGQMGKAVNEFKKAKDELINPSSQTGANPVAKVDVNASAEKVKATPAAATQETGQAQK
jgi:TatA/E family protein of Tat protein translocase